MMESVGLGADGPCDWEVACTLCQLSVLFLNVRTESQKAREDRMCRHESDRSRLRQTESGVSFLLSSVSTADFHIESSSTLFVSFTSTP